MASRDLARTTLRTLAVFTALILFSSSPLWADEMAHGFIPPVWTILPFAGILLSIALLPLLAPHIWEHHFGKISAFWLAAALVLMVVSVPAETGFIDAYGPKLFSTGEEYIAFIILLGSLFVITGGIHISGNFPGSPLVNVGIITIGTLLASVIGTTGAAMLLVRPIIRANQNRKNNAHVIVFFIFQVCNIGGSLTPIGDPPLFLGFLQGVPFEWTLTLFPEWLFTSAVVIGVFYGMDRYLFSKEGGARPTGAISVRVEGGINFLLLGGVIGAVILSGLLHLGAVFTFGSLGEIHGESLLRDGAQIVLALLSVWLTAKAIRGRNNFNYGPIKEVAYLFIGIFTTMIPALMLLNARGGELGITTPNAYFWAAGSLSSFLDNAPTYLTFLATAMGSLGIAEAAGMVLDPAAEQILKGISLGAVFMGANTYIGNGPNFMVKAVAESAGVKMPSFFGYMVYSCLILLPVFLLMGLIFL